MRQFTSVQETRQERGQDIKQARLKESLQRKTEEKQKEELQIQKQQELNQKEVKLIKKSIKKSSMGWFSKLRSVASSITHPAKLLKKIGSAVVKAEKSIGKTIVKTAHIVEKVGGVALDVAHKGLDFVEDHAKDIKQVVDITAEVITVIGVATGQPEIVAGAQALKAGADKALDLAQTAGKIVDTADKALMIAKAIREKEKIGVILHRTADTMLSAGQVSGNQSLINMAGQVKDGAHVVDMAIGHAKDLHQATKDSIDALKKGDIVGAVGGVIKGVESVIEIKDEKTKLLDILLNLSKANEKQAETIEVSAPFGSELSKSEIEDLEDTARERNAVIKARKKKKPKPKKKPPKKKPKKKPTKKPVKKKAPKKKPAKKKAKKKTKK